MARFAAACVLLLLAIGAQATFSKKPGPVDAVLKLKKKALCKKLAMLGNDQEESCKEFMDEKEKGPEILYVKVQPKSTGPLNAPEPATPEIQPKKTALNIEAKKTAPETAPTFDAKKTAQSVQSPAYPLKVVKVVPPATKATKEPAKKPFAGQGKLRKIIRP